MSRPQKAQLFVDLLDGIRRDFPPSGQRHRGGQGPRVRSELRVGQARRGAADTGRDAGLKPTLQRTSSSRRRAFEEAIHRSDRQQASSTNPVPRQLWRRRRVNGALLSGWYLGPHRNPSATRPPVDVQSVLCDAASNPNSGLEENSKSDYRIPPTSIRLINWEVPVDRLGVIAAPAQTPQATHPNRRGNRLALRWVRLQICESEHGDGRLQCS